MLEASNVRLVQFSYLEHLRIMDERLWEVGAAVGNVMHTQIGFYQNRLWELTYMKLVSMSYLVPMCF